MSNKLTHTSLPVDIISQYRTELMGFAIFGVLLGHLMNETWQPVILSQITRLIHTAGFIFLSGFGLYYAFQKNRNLAFFYKKRLIRIFVPFALITYWFFILAYACGEESLGKCFTDLTATSFWFFGEAQTWAMWYVSATIVLYLLFPLIYYVLFAFRSPAIGLAAISVVYAVSLYLIACFCPDYWMDTRIFFARFIMFPLGIFTGYLSANAKKVSAVQIICYFAVCIVMAAVAKLWIDDEIYAVIRTLIGLPLVTLFLHWLSKRKWAETVIFRPLHFGGVYSYELYLIHVIIFYLCRNIIGINSAVSMIIGIGISLLICQPVHKGINRLFEKK